MALGIMQPYFFPYPGYFSLIKATDKLILFDISQYVRHSWMNRNRIIDANSLDSRYLTVSVQKSRLSTPINKTVLYNYKHWKTKVDAQLEYYRRYAPHYTKVVDFLNESLRPDFSTLSDLNIHTLKSTCAYIGLNLNYEIFSEMNLQLEPVKAADEWGVNICKAMGVDAYINPIGGQSFMDVGKYQRNHVDIKFLKYGYKPYDQGREEFIPGLSIIDAMMFNTPEELYQMLDDYQLVD